MPASAKQAGGLRYYAARALERIGDAESVPFLQQAIRIAENVLQEEVIRDALMVAARRGALVS